MATRGNNVEMTSEEMDQDVASAVDGHEFAEIKDVCEFLSRVRGEKG